MGIPKVYVKRFWFIYVDGIFQVLDKFHQSNFGACKETFFRGREKKSDSAEFGFTFFVIFFFWYLNKIQYTWKKRAEISLKICNYISLIVEISLLLFRFQVNSHDIAIFAFGHFFAISNALHSHGGLHRMRNLVNGHLFLSFGPSQ